MAPRTTLRRLTLGALLTGAAWLTLTALDGAAHADDGTQQPGGVLGAVVEVVDQVLPEPTKAADPARDEPAEDPEPPADDDGEGEDQGSSAEPESAPDPIGDILDGVTDTVETVAEVVVTTPPPVTIPPVVATPTPTTSTPAPATTPAVAASTTAMVSTPAARTDTEAADDTDTAEPETAAQPAPVDLPVPIGPALGRTLDDGIHYTDRTAPAADEVRECGADLRSLDAIRRAIRATGDTPAAPTTNRAGSRDDRPCPTGPGGPVARAGTMVAVANNGPGHGDQTCGDILATLTWPTLSRLHPLRARGDLPASRSPHVDSGPA